MSRLVALVYPSVLIRLRFDYIARDVRAIGDHNNFSARRLIDSARVIDNEICYHIKDANSLYELCTLRFSNHKRIYSHKTARAIEYMLIDALKSAEPVMKIACWIENPRKYVHLTDNIRCRIEEMDDPELRPAQDILERIHKRDLYKIVDWRSFAFRDRERLKQALTSEKIVEAAKSFSPSEVPNLSQEDVLASLSIDHVIVDIGCIHHGMKEKNPLDSVKFYGKHNIHGRIPFLFAG